MEITTTSPEETARLGRLLGEACRGGEVILLNGDLGAGKTTLTQGIARGLGVTVPVVSPTFIVLREYEGRLPLYHFDFYRVEHTERAVDLEFDDYLGGDGVCVIEWASRAPEIAPEDSMQVSLRVDGPSSRLVSLRATASRYSALLRALEGRMSGLDVMP